MLVTIAHYKYLLSASLAKALLEKEHILSIVYNASPKTGIVGDYTLIVLKDNAEQASTVLGHSHLL